MVATSRPQDERATPVGKLNHNTSRHGSNRVLHNAKAQQMRVQQRCLTAQKRSKKGGHSKRGCALKAHLDGVKDEAFVGVGQARIFEPLAV